MFPNRHQEEEVGEGDAVEDGGEFHVSPLPKEAGELKCVLGFVHPLGEGVEVPEGNDPHPYGKVRLVHRKKIKTL